jgi:hypothetical protein
MSYGSARHETRESCSPLCVLAFAVLVVFSMLLGGMRLYCLNVEHRISEVSSRIERIRDKNAELEDNLAGLLSPARIYTFARMQLGMTNVRTVEIVRVRGTLPGIEYKLAAGTERSGGLIGPGGLEACYTSQAHAED